MTTAKILHTTLNEKKSKMEENYYNKNSDFPKATTNKQKPSTEWIWCLKMQFDGCRTKL